MNDDFLNIAEILKNKKGPKPPAYEWQDLALSVIKDLGVPGFKRSSVFKVCKELPKEVIRRALIDTKELCPSGQKWKYFFKILEKYMADFEWQEK